MFCIFPAISLTHAFTLEATEKGLRYFSFSDVFRIFKISGYVSHSENSTKIYVICVIFELNTSFDINTSWDSEVESIQYHGQDILAEKPWP